MKKFALMLMTLLAFTAFAACSDDDNEISGTDVPEIVKANFTKKYPGSKVADWDLIGRFYVAEFYYNTFESEGWFTQSGTWTMTETDYGSNITMLPIDVQNAFNDSKYSGAMYIVDDAKVYDKPIASFCVIEVENVSNGSEINLFYDTFGDLLNTVSGDYNSITPDTDPSAIIF